MPGVPSEAAVTTSRRPAPSPEAAARAASLKACRTHLGLTQTKMGAALGYRGTNLRQMMHDLETGRKTITETVMRLAEMYRMHGIPERFS